MEQTQDMEHHRLGLFSMDRILPEPGSCILSQGLLHRLPSQQILASPDQSSGVWTGVTAACQRGYTYVLVGLGQAGVTAD